MRYLGIALAWICLVPLAAESLVADQDRRVVVPLAPPTDARPEPVRTVVFPGAQTIAVDAFQSGERLDMVWRGNSLTVRLLDPTAVRIPVVVYTDEPEVYHLEFGADDRAAEADAVMYVTAAAIGQREPVQQPAIEAQSHGGTWETNTNKVLRLHLHIRGGRRSSDIASGFSYNETALREGRRVPGRVLSEMDDWLVEELSWWSLDNVRASYLRVTYRGREPLVRFHYQMHQTDRSIAVHHVIKQPGEVILDPKNPGVEMRQGEPAFFILYQDMR